MSLRHALPDDVNTMAEVHTAPATMSLMAAEAAETEQAACRIFLQVARASRR